MRTDKANIWLATALNSTFRILHPAVTLTVKTLVVSPTPAGIQVIAVLPDPDPVTTSSDSRHHQVQAPPTFRHRARHGPGNEPRTIPPGDNQIFTPVVARGSRASGATASRSRSACGPAGMSACPPIPANWQPPIRRLSTSPRLSRVSDAPHHLRHQLAAQRRQGRRRLRQCRRRTGRGQR